MEINSGSVLLLTYKDGLLSRLGHDLQLSLARFTIAVGDSEVAAVFHLDSLQVVGACEERKLCPNVLSADQRAQIHAAMHDKVLRTRDYPQARFSATWCQQPDWIHAEGELDLCGQSAPLAITVEECQGYLRGKKPRSHRRVGGFAHIVPYWAP